ncbi:putative short chain dehydrogenase/ reductase [Hypoxylon crocopeplum]|nr:putative short chain dehydrogenase/ reductase [Hypoxylon crocopeplum]
MPPIAGQNVLVIGGSSGIGAAVAKLACAEGLNVSVASSNPSRVETAVRRIREAVPGARVLGFVCDVNHDDAESSLEKLFADVKVAAGGQPLDHIIYTSVVLDLRPLSEVSMAYLRDASQFKYVVPLLIGKLAPRYVKQSHTSSLIFTSGRVAEKPVKGSTVVSGMGAALFGVTRGLALDIAPIRVNLVSPGVVDTEMLRSDEKIARAVEMMTKNSLLGKIGTPEEVAEAYIYLMKDTNSTGSVVSTNGGALIE